MSLVFAVKVEFEFTETIQSITITLKKDFLFANMRNFDLVLFTKKEAR